MKHIYKESNRKEVEDVGGKKRKERDGARESNQLVHEFNAVVGL